jgi:nucleotide-binding universal stress UspA family protein
VTTNGHAASLQGPLIVGVDRSDESAVALRTAILVANAMTVPLTVVHAIGLLEEAGYRTAPPVDEMVTRARHDAEVSAHDVDVVTEDGPAADVLLRVAARIGARIIVVGRRGLGAAPRPLGSVSEAVLAHAAVPVLVVPVDAGDAST